MYMSKKDLLKIAKEHNLRGCVNYTKPQLINRLRGEGLLPEGVIGNGTYTEWLGGGSS